jgi:hypothetical protein
VKLKKDVKLMSSAVLVVVLKILNLDDRPYNQIFDAIVGELSDDQQQSASELNQLSAIIFDFIKQGK